MAKKRANGEGSIFQRPNGLWAALITVGREPTTGKLKRKSFSGKTRKEVQDKVNSALYAIQTGTYIEPTKLTVAEWLNTWLMEYKKPSLRPTTFESYETMIRCHLNPTLGHLKLKDLRGEHLQHLYNEKGGPGGLSSRTVRYIHAVIHQALEQAIKNQLITRNVSVATVLPREKRKPIQPLDLQQAKQLIANIKNDRLFPAILLELNSGLRRGELLALRWKDIDFKTETLTVRQNLVRIKSDHASGETKTCLVFQEPKTASSFRTIPISNEAMAELKRHRAHQAEEKLMNGHLYNDNDLVFCLENGSPIDPRNFTRYFESALCIFRPHPDTHFGNIRTAFRNYPDSISGLSGHLSS